MVGSGENGVKWAFCRTRYRSGCWDENARKCLFYKEFVDGTDMPFLAIEHLFQNVNIPLSIPNKRSRICYNSTVLWYVFYCQVKILYMCFSHVSVQSCDLSSENP